MIYIFVVLWYLWAVGAFSWFALAHKGVVKDDWIRANIGIFYTIAFLYAIFWPLTVPIVVGYIYLYMENNTDDED